jgi:MFS family permease
MLQDPVSGIGLTEVNYGYIVTAFSLAYALGLLVVGGFIDVWHKNRLRGCSRGLDPGRRTGIAAACQSGNLSVITEGARLYVDIVREVQREATARMA